MSENANNLIGRRFGKLTVIAKSVIPKNSRGFFWDAICDCGHHRTVRGDSLMRGKTLSCGCLQREWARAPKPNRRIKVSPCAHCLLKIGLGRTFVHKRTGVSEIVLTRLKKEHAYKTRGRFTHVFRTPEESRQRTKETARRKLAEYTQNLAPSYILKLLNRDGSSLLRRDIPDEVLELKKLQVELRREKLKIFGSG